jgi:hypothetical protein
VLSLRWYDHKAYTVCSGGAETAAFIIATDRDWELRVRPAGPLDKTPDPARRFPLLGDAQEWLRTDEGRAWLDQIGEA